MLEAANDGQRPDERGEPPEPIEPASLRILLAHDLSPASDRAAALIGSTGWPKASVVRIVTSPIGVGGLLSSFAGIRETRQHARAVREAIRPAHARVAADLWNAGFVVETATVPGDPARAIVRDAGRFGADLIVVGASHQGPLATMLLGSVSRGVVENAPCSVLASRGSAVSRVLLATDGSPSAELAVSIVATWPLFAPMQIRVVCVGEGSSRDQGDATSDAGLATDTGDPIPTEHAQDVVHRTVERLAAGGRQVEMALRSGDAAAELVTMARDWPADLVVLGSHGHSLLRRLLLGSVARKVLDGAASSVLVARPRRSAPATAGDAATR